MSVVSFLNAAKELFEKNYFEEALCLTCIAVDACAAIQYPNKQVTERYKLFLKKNFNVITRFGFPGIYASSLRIKINGKVPNLILDEQGYVGMDQIIYHVIRCGLIHDCKIDHRICFTEKTIIGDWNEDKFFLPSAIIYGLIAAVEKNLIN